MTLDRSRIVAIVRALPIFGSVPEQAGADLIGSGELLEYGAGQLLIKQGEQSDDIDQANPPLIREIFLYLGNGCGRQGLNRRCLSRWFRPRQV